MLVEARTPAPAALTTAPPPVRPVVIAAGSRSLEVAAGEVLFRLDDDADEAAVVARLEELGAVWWHLGGDARLGRAVFDADDDLVERLAQVGSLAGVQEATPNAIVRGAARGGNGGGGGGGGGGTTSTSTTSTFTTTSTLSTAPTACLTDPVVNDLQWELDTITRDPECATASTHGGTVIALLDTGVAYEDHTDASGTYVASWELAGVPFVHPWDFVNNDAHANDDHQHGTHLAGLLASRGYLSGHAPNPTLMPVKVLDHSLMGTEWGLIQGVQWAVDHGAEIINLSLSFGLGYLPSQALIDVINEADAQDVIVVAAAGNDGVVNEIGYPAALHSVIAVGASRMRSGSGVKRTVYSNKGWALDLLGPGGALEWDVEGDGIPDGLVAETIDPADPTALAYWVMAGTSQAAAVVSGQVAHALETLAPSEIRAALVLATTPTARQTQVGVGRGRGQTDRALLAQQTSAGVAALPEAYVNFVSGIRSTSSGDRGVVVHAEVVDGTGSPLTGVFVAGSVRGSTTGRLQSVTDGQGRATLLGPTVAAAPTDPLVFHVALDLVLVPADGVLVADVRDEPLQNQYPARPGGFYRLSEATATVLDAAIETDPSGGLAFFADPAAAETCATFDCSSLDPSYSVRSLGGGFSSSTLNVTFNAAYLNYIFGSGFSSSTFDVEYQSALKMPWGYETSGEFDRYTFGGGFSSSTLNVYKYDRSLYGDDMTDDSVSLLAYDSREGGTGENSTDLNHLESDADLWGSGFSSSTLNVMWRSPSFLYGSGFSSSTVDLASWSSTTLLSPSKSLLDWNERISGGGFSASVVNLYSWTAWTPSASVWSLPLATMGPAGVELDVSGTSASVAP